MKPYDEYDPREFDNNAAYYQGGEEPDYGDAAEEAELYDIVYTAYVEARKRFNDIKLSRGFLPIVALADGSPTGVFSAVPSPPSSPIKGKGYGNQKGKGKGSPKSSKGKSKNKGPPRGPFLAAVADPRGRAQAALAPPTCLRCGQLGHTTINYPVPKLPYASPIGSPSKKRPSPSVESMAFNDEQAVVTFQDQDGDRVDCCMLDPGASAMLAGYGPFLRYMRSMQERGFKMEDLKFIRCDRKFFFGGDANNHCSWTVMLPAETPMLLGHPIMEAPGLTLDCKNRKLKFEHTPWQDAVVVIQVSTSYHFKITSMSAT